MSNEKFAQGEWRTNQRPHGKVSVVGENGQQVCLMWNSKQRDTNAHLVSAAPDMYRVLRNVVCSPSETRGDITQVALTQAEVDAIRAALAKADGEPQ